MTIELTSLAQFKRWLNTEGAQMRLMERHVFDSGTQTWRQVDLSERVIGWRDVTMVQTNGFELTNKDGGDSWCDFGKASEWKFGKGTAYLTTGEWGVKLCYELRIKGEDK